MKNTLRVLGSVILIMATVFLATSVKPVTAEEQPEANECQYPGRWSNPVGGCDNSDPAVPACTHFMYSQDAESKCIAEYTKANTPSKTTVNPVKPKQPVKQKATCND